MGLKTPSQVANQQFDASLNQSIIDQANITDPNDPRAVFDAVFAEPVKPIAQQQPSSSPTVISDVAPGTTAFETSDINLDRYRKVLDGNIDPTTDLEEQAAANQTTAQKWGYGLTKFLGKTGTAVLGGTAGMIYGIPAMIADKSWSAFYDNEFSTLMREWDQGMDASMPTFYRRKEEDYNFFQKMGTANFWSNDFLGSMSFTAGAVVTELLWSAATAATLGALAPVQGAATTGMLARLTGYLRQGKKLADLGTGMRNTKLVAGIADAATVSRQFITGAAYEASVEANMFKEQAVNQLKQEWLAANPEQSVIPSEKLAEFEDQVTNAANGVFAANLGIVGLSNFVAFNQIFGKGLRSVSGSIGKIEMASGKAAAAYKGFNWFEKAASNVYTFGKNPLVEGVWEEGMQGVTQNAALDYVMHKYDPSGTRAAHSLIESIGEGFQKEFTSKEGGVDIGMGMLIGALGLPNVKAFGRVSDGGGKAHFGRMPGQPIWSGGIIGEFSQRSIQRQATDEATAAVNKIDNEKLTQFLKDNPQALQSTAASLQHFIRSTKVTNDLDLAIESGDLYTAKNHEHDILHSFIASRIDAGLGGQMVDDFTSMVNSMNTEQFKSMFGYSELSDADVAARKSEVIDSFNKRVKATQEAVNTVDAVIHADIKQPHFRDLRESMVYALSVGEDIDRRIDALKRAISDKVGTTVDPKDENFAETKNAVLKALEGKPDTGVRTMLDDVQKLIKRKNQMINLYNAMLTKGGRDKFVSDWTKRKEEFDNYVDNTLLKGLNDDGTMTMTMEDGSTVTAKSRFVDPATNKRYTVIDGKVLEVDKDDKPTGITHPTIKTIGDLSRGIRDGQIVPDEKAEVIAASNKSVFSKEKLKELRKKIDAYKDPFKLLDFYEEEIAPNNLINDDAIYKYIFQRIHHLTGKAFNTREELEDAVFATFTKKSDGSKVRVRKTIYDVKNNRKKGYYIQEVNSKGETHERYITADKLYAEYDLHEETHDLRKMLAAAKTPKELGDIADTIMTLFPATVHGYFDRELGELRDLLNERLAAMVKERNEQILVATNWIAEQESKFNAMDDTISALRDEITYSVKMAEQFKERIAKGETSVTLKARKRSGEEGEVTLHDVVVDLQDELARVNEHIEQVKAQLVDAHIARDVLKQQVEQMEEMIQMLATDESYLLNSVDQTFDYTKFESWQRVDNHIKRLEEQLAKFTAVKEELEELLRPYEAIKSYITRLLDRSMPISNIINAVRQAAGKEKSPAARKQLLQFAKELNILLEKPENIGLFTDHYYGLLDSYEYFMNRINMVGEKLDAKLKERAALEDFITNYKPDATTAEFLINAHKLYTEALVIKQQEVKKAAAPPTVTVQADPENPVPPSAQNNDTLEQPSTFKDAVEDTSVGGESTTNPFFVPAYSGGRKRSLRTLFTGLTAGDEENPKPSSPRFHSNQRYRFFTNNVRINGIDARYYVRYMTMAEFNRIFNTKEFGTEDFEIEQQQLAKGRVEWRKRNGLGDLTDEQKAAQEEWAKYGYSSIVAVVMRETNGVPRPVDQDGNPIEWSEVDKKGVYTFTATIDPYDSTTGEFRTYETDTAKINEAMDQHLAFRKEVMTSGEGVLRNINGKSSGIVVLDENGQLSQLGRLEYSIPGTSDDWQVQVATLDETEFSGGAKFNTRPGFVYIYNKANGSLYHMQPRTLDAKEIDLVAGLLTEYVKGFKPVPQGLSTTGALKTQFNHNIKQMLERIVFWEGIDDVGKNPEKRFRLLTTVDGKTVPGGYIQMGTHEPLPLVIMDKDNKPTINPAVVDYLRGTFLPSLRVQVNNRDLASGEKYAEYGYVDGKITLVKEWPNYKEYLLAKVLQTGVIRHEVAKLANKTQFINKYLIVDTTVSSPEKKQDVYRHTGDAAIGREVHTVGQLYPGTYLFTFLDSGGKPTRQFTARIDDTPLGKKIIIVNPQFTQQVPASSLGLQKQLTDLFNGKAETKNDVVAGSNLNTVLMEYYKEPMAAAGVDIARAIINEYTELVQVEQRQEQASVDITPTSEPVVSDPGYEPIDWSLLTDNENVNDDAIPFVSEEPTVPVEANNTAPSLDSIQMPDMSGVTPPRLEDSDGTTSRLEDNNTLRRPREQFDGVIDMAAEEAWFKERFPSLIPFFGNIQTMAQLGGAFGSFWNGAVYIYKNAEVGTTYHEAWHVVTHMYLDKKERSALYREYRQRTGKYSMTNAQIEEALAEEFRDYTMGKSILEIEGSRQRTFFRKLWDFILKLIGVARKHNGSIEQPAGIKDMFNRIQTGYYRDKAPRFSGVGVKLNSMPGKSEKFVNEANMAVSYLFFKHLRNMPDGIQSLINNGRINGQVLEELYRKILHSVDPSDDSITKRIRDASAELQLESTSPARRTQLLGYLDNLQYLRDNFYMAKGFKGSEGQRMSVVGNHQNYLRKYKLEIDTYDIDRTRENDRTSTDSTSDWHFNSLLISTKRNANIVTKLLTAMLTDAFTTGEIVNGKPVVKLHVGPFSIPRVVDYNKTFNALINKLSNTTSIAHQKQVLDELLTEIPAVDTLIRELNLHKPDLTGIGMEQVQTLLGWSQTFRKNRNQFLTVTVGANGGYYFGDANFNSHSIRIREAWHNNAESRTTTYEKPEGARTYTFRASFANSLPNFDKADKSFTMAKDVFLLLDQMGITYSKIDYNVLRSNDPIKVNREVAKILKTDDDVDAFMRRFKHMVKNIKTVDAKGVRNISNLFDVRFNKLGSKDDIDFFVRLEQESSLDYVENSFQNNEGERVYLNSLNNFISNVINIINSPNIKTKSDLLDALPHLRSAYNRHSVWIDSMFDTNGRKKRDVEFSYNMLDALNNVTFHNGKAYVDMSTADRYSVILAATLQGYTQLFRASDNKVERLFATPFQLTRNDITSGELDRILKGYIIDEIMFAREMLDSVEKWDKSKEAAQRGILLDLIPAAKKTMIYSRMATEPVESVIDSLWLGDEGLKAIITKFVAESQKAAFARLIDLNIVDKRNDGFYTNYGVPAGEGVVALSEDEINNRLELFVYSFMIGNIEQTKLFTSHPAFYGSVDNFFKRMSALTGTKMVPNTDPMINNWIDLYLKRQDGKTTAESRKFGMPTIKTAVFSEFEVASVYTQMYVKKLMDQGLSLEEATAIIHPDGKGYDKISEADGQGIISLDEYREFKFRIGDWSLGKEATYLSELGHKVFPNEPIYGSYAGKPLTSVTMEVLNPIKPQHFGSLATDGFIPGHYKLSLYPALPSLISKFPNSNLARLTDYMRSNRVGIVTFTSAVKVGNKVDSSGSVPSIYNKEGKLNTDAAVTQDTFYHNWGIQVDTGNHVKNFITTGTQAAKHILDAVMESGVYRPMSFEVRAYDPQSGEWKSKELTKPSAAETERRVKDYITLNNRRITLGLTELSDKLGIVHDGSNWVVKDSETFITLLTKEITKRDLPENVLKSAEALRSSLNRFGMTTVINARRLEDILVTLADKFTLSQKRFGRMAIEASPAMFEEYDVTRLKNGVLVSGHLKSYEDVNGKLTAMEVYLPHWFKDAFGIAKDGKLNVNDIHDKRLLEMIGFRIPTAGLNSIDSFIVKDFLPESCGEMVVIPSELVTKSGTDFDVDKLNIYLPNFYIDRNGRPVYIEYGNKDQYDEYVNAQKPKLNSKLLNALKGAFPFSDALVNKYANEVFNSAQQGNTKGEVLRQVLSYIDTDLDNMVDKGRSLPKGSDESAILYSQYQRLAAFRQRVEDFLETSDDAEDLFELDIMTPAQFEIRAIENEQLQLYRDFIHSPDNFQQLITPTASNLIEDAAVYSLWVEAGKKGTFEQFKTARAAEIKSRPYYKLIDPIYNLDVAERLLTAKTMVGPVALQSTNDTIAQQVNFRVGKTFKMEVGTNKFESRSTCIELATQSDRNTIPSNSSFGMLMTAKDANGNEYLIPQLLNQSIQSMTDAAKNPFIIDGGINNMTLGVFTMLMRRQVPPQLAILFLKQPIVRRYLHNDIKYGNLVAEANTSGKATSTTPKRYKSKIIEQTLNEFFVPGMSEADQKLFNFSGHVFTQEELERMLIEYNSVDGKATEMNEKSRRNQQKILHDFLRYVEMAKVLNAHIQSTSYDTRGMGLGFSEALIRLNHTDNMINDTNRQLITNFRDAFSTSQFFGAYYNTAQEIMRMFKAMTYDLNNQAIVDRTLELIRMLTAQGMKTSLENITRIVDRFRGDLLTYVLTTKPSMINNVRQTPMDTERQRLFYGENSVPKRIAAIQALKRSAPVSSDSIERHRQFMLVDNVLIDSLQPLFHDDLDNLALRQTRLDSLTSNQLTREWLNLLDIDQQLGIDLIKFSILQSGVAGSLINFTQLIPAEVYTQLITSALGEVNNNNNGIPNDTFVDFMMQFFLNNATDNILVPMHNDRPGVRVRINPALPLYKVRIENKDFQQELQRIAAERNIPKERWSELEGEVRARRIPKYRTDVYAIYVNPHYNGSLVFNNDSSGRVGMFGWRNTAKKKQMTEYHVGTKAVSVITDPFHVVKAVTKPVVVAEPTLDLSYDANYMPVTTVISGLQNGVDQDGLEIAAELGYATGGTGTPDLGQEGGYKATAEAKKYGVKPIAYQEQTAYALANPQERSAQHYYKARTLANVRNSDATVYFSTKEDSAGLSATRDFATKLGKPFFLYGKDFTTAAELRKLLQMNNIKVLNVAGNRLSALTPDVREKFRNILRQALDKGSQNVVSSQNTNTPTLFDMPEVSTINVWAGNNEHAELSNMAVRPFVIGNDEFDSVEQYFQYQKFHYTIDGITKEQFEHNQRIADRIMSTTDGFELKKLGQQFQALDVSRWDKQAASEMLKAIRASFEQNEDAKQALLATGTAVITHKGTKTDRWTKDFPKLLMQVRSELSSSKLTDEERKQLDQSESWQNEDNDCPIPFV